MSQLIKLSVVNRGQFPNPELLKSGPTDYGFDVEDIVSPIRFDSNLSKSYFTARTNKDGANNNLNGSKIGYMASDSLLSIAAQSDKLLLLTVVTRRGVDMNSESYVFVSSKISENFIPVVSGTKFFYIEDGDPLPVEYIVEETIDEILTQSTVDAEHIFELTWTEAQALAAAGLLDPLNGFKKGAHYHITDARGTDGGVILFAVSETELSLEGEGFFLNPDFQDVGDYGGLTSSPNANRGVWSLSQQAGIPFSNDNICFWNGLMYQVIDDSKFDTNSPDANTDAYQLLSKSITNGYIKEVDFINYDFTSDQIIKREDKRGNTVHGHYAILAFQWGNNNVINNYVCINGHVDCINAKGVLQSNIFNAYVIFNKGVIETCNFIGGINVVINNCMALQESTFDVDDIKIDDANMSFLEGQINNQYSSLQVYDGSGDGILNLDMADPSIFSAGILTIPTKYDLCGNFRLVNAGMTTDVINKIVNLPSAFKTVRFICEDGLTETFSHTSIATAVADNLVSDAATINDIVGRINGYDYIEYQKIGNLNLRTNIVKLA